MGPIRALRSIGNSFGLAWWARIETNQPDVSYWFGPFLTRRCLKIKLSGFVEDLSNENPKDIKHRLIRGKRCEPLTT